MDSPEQLLKDFETALQGVFRKLEEELRAIRSNRPSVQLVEGIRFEFYGQPLAVNQAGSLSIHPPRDIMVNVWDKNAVVPMIKAIEAAKIGVSVTNEGNTVRVSLPPLTDERRQEFMKLVRKIAEGTRIQVRNRRDGAVKKTKAAEDEKKLNEDQVFKAREAIQKAVDEANKRIESLLEAKLKELSE